MGGGIKSVYIPNGYIAALYNIFTNEPGVVNASVIGAYEISVLTSMVSEEFNALCTSGGEVGVRIYSGPVYVTEITRPSGEVYRDSSREEYLNIVGIFEECSGVRPEFSSCLPARKEITSLMFKYINASKLPLKHKEAFNKNIAMLLDNPIFNERLSNPNSVELLKTNLYFLKSFNENDVSVLKRSLRNYLKTPYCTESIDQNSWGGNVLAGPRYVEFMVAFMRAVEKFNKFGMYKVYDKVPMKTAEVKKDTEEINALTQSDYGVACSVNLD